MKTIDHADLLAKPGRTINLADFDPALTCDFSSKSDAQGKLHADIERLSALQDMFYADEIAPMPVHRIAMTRDGVLRKCDSVDAGGYRQSVGIQLTKVTECMFVDAARVQATFMRNCKAR